MSYYFKNGNTFQVSAENAAEVYKKLPTGNYVVKFNKNSNQFYLETVDLFTSPKKVYGNTTQRAERIINTFLDRPAATGVMLTGEKGSGKTLLARAISIACYSKEIPTIIINAPWTGDEFNSFIQSIDQPCVIVFDEFEKVYDKDDQESILTLLDGVFPTKKLFVLTCNDKWRVDSHMRNRPGRIYYMLDFDGLDQNFIIEYCEDNLNNRSYIEKICKIAKVFDKFNFDMLKAIVEECNRYNEDPQSVLEMLNTKPEFSSLVEFEIYRLVIDGKIIDRKMLQDSTWTGNPLTIKDQICMAYKIPDNDDPTDYSWEYCYFEQNDLYNINAEQGLFEFKNIFNQQLTIKRREKSMYDIRNAF